MRRMRRTADVKRVVDALNKYDFELRQKNQSEQQAINNAIAYFSTRNNDSLSVPAFRIDALGKISGLMDGGKIGETEFSGISNMAELASTDELSNALREEYADVLQGKYNSKGTSENDDMKTFIKNVERMDVDIYKTWNHSFANEFMKEMKAHYDSNIVNLKEWWNFTNTIDSKLENFFSWMYDFYDIVRKYKTNGADLEWRRNVARQYGSYLAGTISDVKYYANELEKVMNGLKDKDSKGYDIFKTFHDGILKSFDSMRKLYDWVMS